MAQPISLFGTECVPLGNTELSKTLALTPRICNIIGGMRPLSINVSSFGIKLYYTMRPS